MSVILCSSVTFAQEQTKDTEKPDFITTATDWFESVKLPDYLQIHGFVSQAFISTSDNDVFGDTDDDGSFGFTEAGLNALLRPLPRLQLSAQVLSRRAGEGNSGSPRLDFGFADYRLYSHETNQFGIRVGRLKNPFGFYNDTRDVAFTRPSILLPQSIYFDRTRNFGLSSDVVQLYGEASHANLGSISIQFGVGRPIVKDKDTESSLLVGLRPGELEPELSYIGRGIYESSNNRFRLALSGSWTNTDYDPGKNDPLAPGSIQFSPIFVSAQYNAERWSLTSEYALRHFKYNGFNGSSFNGLDFFGESYYFQGEYRFNQKWEAILRYDVLFTDRKDRDGSEFAATSRQPAHTRFAKDLTAGLRWNVTPSFMLRAEYHYVNGTA
ncbi:MAG: OprO/OprP family phosphate-selective porin, partial [Betaproteobacteria bacterium]|nr:OprO/OprP family phosphate-selective porin [Betaproteobacteria bacterium]